MHIDAVKPLYRGASANRYSTNPCELALAEAWQALNERRYSHQVLANILSDTNVPAAFTDRDMWVAASVIAWLGTNVGAGFLAHLIAHDDRCTELRRVLVYALQSRENDMKRARAGRQWPICPKCRRYRGKPGELIHGNERRKCLGTNGVGGCGADTFDTWVVPGKRVPREPKAPSQEAK